MPSDFEKNKEQELDRYGVWIKSGPQDVNDTTGDTAVNLEPPVELQDLQEKQPVSENPASVDGSIEPESGAETETAEPDETGVQDALEELDLPPLSDFNSLDEETELPVKDEEITEADFEIQPSTEIKTSEGTENTMPEDTGSSKESPHINIVQDDGAASFEDDSLAEPDDDNESDALPEEQTITVENDWISDKEDVPVWESEKTSHEADLKDAENDADSPESGSIVFAEDREEESRNIDSKSTSDSDTGFMPEDISPVHEFEVNDTKIENIELPVDSTNNGETNTDETPGTWDSEFPDFSAFLDESELSQIDNMTPPPRTEKKESSGDGMEEISMDDFGLSDDFSEISLDDFMSDGSSSKAKENQAVFDDTPPLNIDLEFDDEFIEESKKMSRTQTDSDDLLSQFFDDDFGVEIIDESPDLSESSKISGKKEQTGSTDFDLSEIEGFEMFDDTEASPVSEEKPHEDNISSIGKTEEISLSDFDTESTGSETPETVKSSGGNDGSEDVTSEFDDILSEIGPSANQGSQSIDKPSSGDINLTVTVEDDEETEEEPEPEMDNLEEEEEEISVPIYIEDAGKTPEPSKPNNAPSPGDFDLSEIEGFEFLDSDSPSKKSEQNETVSEETITQEETTAEPVVAEDETPLADLDFAEPALQEEEIIAEPAEEDDEITAEPVVAEDETIAEPVVAEDETIAEPVVVEDETIAEPVVAEDETIAEPVVAEDETIAEPVVAEDETIAEPVVAEDETIAEPVVAEDETIAEPVVSEEETPLADLDFAEPALQEEEIIAEPAVEEETIAEPVVVEDEITAEPVVAEEETPLADLDFAEPALQEEEIIAEPAVEEEKCGTEKEADNNKQEQVDAVNSETADVSDMFLESTGNSENTSETMKDLDIPPALGEPGDKETVEINTPKLDITNPFDDSLENTEGDSDTKENEKVESEENMNNDFDDVKAVEQDLLDTETKDTGSEPALDKTNEETTVLRKIAEELTSIRDEITTLKSELNNLKSVDTTASQVEESVQSGDDAGEVSIPTSQNDSENSGFFADDDTDESIALTGDELNNILTTADFTEEKSGVDEDHPVNDDSGEPEEVKTEDVDEGISDFEKELLENDEKTFDEEKAFEDPAYDTVEPVPITKIEDTNYLDGEDESLPAEELAIDEGEIPEIDFNDEVLVEPEETEISDTIKDLDINAKTPEIDTVTQEPTEEKEPEVEKEDNGVFTEELKGEIKTVLAYMDQLLENLPESKIEEFAKSEHFHVYKKLFDELGLS